MLFSSTTFLYYFLPAVLLVYYGLLRRSRPLQNLFLTLASLFFYAWGEPRFVLVMLLSIGANWLFGLGVSRSKARNRPRGAKIWVTAAVLFNLSVLFVFKYLTFTLKNLSPLLPRGFALPEIALPIGISFFTFQALSYVLDVYRGAGEVQKNIVHVGLYISLFPQLIAGPIVRYQTVAAEIVHRRENTGDFFDGFARFVVGLSKKVLLSNSLSVFADYAFAHTGDLTAAYAWLGAVCYTLQIFFDFSGYSDMAIGLGRMFGFHFLENFDYPYISRSVTEFWRRWHISLGTWFRDYVYFPMGGNRVSRRKHLLNLFAVWLLTGIWHGANWTFIAWGLMYFLLLAVEKRTGLDKARTGLWGTAARRCYTLLFVMLGWVIFKSDSLAHAGQYFGAMLGANGTGLWDGLFLRDLRTALIPLAAAVLFSMPVANCVKKRFAHKGALPQILYYLLLFGLFVLSVASIESSAHNPFIYFNF
ncbi:MAG: MBOAT family protein [Clostridia bacterium]|nr:MBOAT family protein [Clostridia bacterium]